MAKHDPVFDIEADAVVVVRRAKELDPQAIGESLTDTAIRHDGQLHADDVLAEAKNPLHPMHKHLEWDDAKAGHQYRLQQCRAIIRIVRIETGSPVELRRAFISAPSPEGRAYRTLADVLSSQDLRDRILESAQRDLEAWQARFRDLRDLVALVEPALVELKRRRRKTTPPADDRPGA